MKETGEKKLGGRALIPLIVFVLVYLAAGIYYQAQGADMAFYQFPIVAASLLGVILSFAITKGSIDSTFKIFARGVGNIDILTMLMIYVLAGAFSSTATAMGGRDAVVNFGLSIVPPQFLAAGIFVIAAFFGTATGTSCGTISAIVPIAAAVAIKGGLSVPIVVGACCGGAMFGDNLSMISDTTIAATRSQGVEMKDKFRVNFFMALPAAIVTLVLLIIFGRPEEAASLGDLSYNLVKILPYLVVLILALVGVNVFLSLVLGILSAGIVGLAFGDLTVATWAQAIWSGITGMDETFYLTVFMGGMAEIVKHNGGLEWLISKVSGIIKGQKSAQFGIAALVSLIDCASANNTVAIIVSGKIAKDVSTEYKVDPRRTASLLDLFSCVFQGIIPYGAQLLIAASLTSAAGFEISPAQIVPSMWYCLLLAVFGIASVFIPFADGVIKKDPWNWEHECAESKVEKA